MVSIRCYLLDDAGQRESEMPEGKGAPARFFVLGKGACRAQETIRENERAWFVLFCRGLTIYRFVLFLAIRVSFSLASPWLLVNSGKSIRKWETCLVRQDEIIRRYDDTTMRSACSIAQRHDPTAVQPGLQQSIVPRVAIASFSPLTGARGRRNTTAGL